MRKRILLIAALWLCLSASLLARADFYDYLKRPEPAYRWEKRGETRADGVTIYDLHLVSQTWQGIVWEHRLQIFYPDQATKPNFCTLLNTGGGGNDRETQMGRLIARQSGLPFAILFGIPKQPLYNGKVEDALVVYTWQKYLETGDYSWPLHFPMAKAVIKAMDAIQAFLPQAGKPKTDEFLITGASKRGWTTWLVGASKDRRVRAIAPMVIDTLNVAAQIPHQLASYGKPSEEIGDYSGAGMLEALHTERGKALLQLEDPYSYRDALTLPKLLINGTNDRYWAQDALNLYWDGLKGPKWVLYVPNSGHGLEDRKRVFDSLTGFAHCIAHRVSLPKMQWGFTESGGSVRLTLRSDKKPLSARLFRATSATKDFRDSKWSSEEMTAEGKRFSGSLAVPASGYAALFGEATYEVGGKRFTLSTQIRIVGSR